MKRQKKKNNKKNTKIEKYFYEPKKFNNNKTSITCFIEKTKLCKTVNTNTQFFQ